MGLKKSDLSSKCHVQIVSTSHSKVLVGIQERTALNQLKPNQARLIENSSKIKSNGYFCFTLANDSDEVITHGRMFAHDIGISEDPVTGYANGPLGAYLVEHPLVSI